MSPKIRPLLLAFSLIWSSCQNESISNQYEKIPLAGWDSTDTKEFRVEILDTLSSYKLFIQIQHADNYRYANLFLLLHTSFSNDTLTQKRIEIPLAKSDGTWLGKGTASLYAQEWLVDTSKFEKRGTYVLRIEQNMREKKLPNIAAIGIRIEKIPDLQMRN